MAENDAGKPGEGAAAASAGEGAAGHGAAGSGQAGSGVPGSGAAGQAGAGQGAFTIPEAYKDKGWAQKVKNLDDLYKQIDTLDSLKGKKLVVPDFEKGDPKDIEEYFKQTRPKDKSEYVFPEGSAKEVTDKIADILYQNGIPKVLGNKIISSYTEIEKSLISERYSKDGMEKVLKTSFGDEYQKVAGESANLLKKHLSQDDQKLLEKIPNEHLGLIYRLTSNVIKTYGIKEGAAGEAGAGAGGAKGNIEETRKTIRAKIEALSKRNHTADEKQKLIKELDATYK